MKIKFLVAATVIACVSVSAPALAQNKAPGSGPNPFVDCGIGADCSHFGHHEPGNLLRQKSCCCIVY